MKRRPTWWRLTAVTVLAVVTSGCGGDDRPSDAAWAQEWQRERSLAPSVDELLDGGRPLCDALVGEYRQLLPRLTPTPTAALDDAVRAWIDHAENIAFDCPLDRAELERRLDELGVLEAEIDAGLRTDAG